MVGAGGVARRHAEVLTGLDADTGGAQIVGVVDTDDGAARALADSFGCPAHTDLEQALDQGEPDAVYVCVPPFAHGEAERAALDRDLPIFVEKPVGLDLSVVEDIARRVERAGVVTGTGYHWRCLDVIGQTQDLLAADAPLLAAGHWLGKRPPVAWWGDRTKSGGQVVEQLTHILDLARLLLGEAHEVYAAGARLAATAEVSGTGIDEIDDATVATVRFASGAVATFAATSVLDGLQRASLQLFSRSLVLEVSEAGLLIDRDQRRTLHEPREDPRVTVDREFIEAVTGRRPATRTPYEQAVESHRLAWTIAQSARHGHAIGLGPDRAASAR